MVSRSASVYPAAITNSIADIEVHIGLAPGLYSQCWVQREPASVAALRCRQLRVQNLHAFNHWRTDQKLRSLLHQRLGDRT